PLPGGAPLMIATAETPLSIAVHDSYVYFTDQGPAAYMGRLARVPIDGGTVEILAENLINSHGIAVDDYNVYYTVSPWSSGMGPAVGSLFKVPKAGGTPTPLATGQPNPDSIAVRNGTVYWINHGYTFNQAQLVSVKSTGGAATILVSPLDFAWSVAVDD